MEFWALVIAVAIAVVFGLKLRELGGRIAKLEARIGAASVAPSDAAIPREVWPRPAPAQQDKPSVWPHASSAAEPVVEDEARPDEDERVPISEPESSAPEPDEEEPEAEQEAAPPKAFKAPQRPKPVDWEKTLGVQLPVWGGAIMLLIAGYFLINWAIESGLAAIFTPTVRVLLCALAAAALLTAAFVVKARRIANGERIAAALATAAIALGYGTMFLAATIFALVPGVAALLGAAGVTAIALVVATRFDQRIMLVGLLGGYLSPLFVWFGGASDALVPAYVIVLLAVSLGAIRWNGWWGQLNPALIAPENRQQKAPSGTLT